MFVWSNKNPLLLQGKIVKAGGTFDGGLIDAKLLQLYIKLGYTKEIKNEAKKRNKSVPQR